MITYKHEDIISFLTESNAIENVYDNLSLVEAKEAWDYAFKNRKKITFEVILGIHKRLMKRQNPRIAGELRDCNVMIGGQIKRFTSHGLLKEEVSNWTKSCQIDKKGIPTSEWPNIITKWHIAFEDIHPFEDGNGRVGRILMNIQRYNYDKPIWIIHEGDEQNDYYQLFNKI